MEAATPQQDLKQRTQPEINQGRAAGCGAGRITPGTPQACSRTPSTSARRRKLMVQCMRHTSRNQRRPYPYSPPPVGASPFTK